MLVKSGKYALRDWKKDHDWQPKMFTYGSYVLDYENKQVGVVAGSINDIHKIETKPKGRGHGTKFIKMMMEEAKRQGKTTFKVQGVIGDTPEDKNAMEHILRDKLGFEQIDNETWIKRL